MVKLLTQSLFPMLPTKQWQRGSYSEINEETNFVFPGLVDALNMTSFVGRSGDNTLQK